MKIKDLKHVKDCPTNFELENEQKFIYWYGQFNCKVLKAKVWIYGEDLRKWHECIVK